MAETLVRLWRQPAASVGTTADTPATPAARPERMSERIPLRILVAEDNAVNQRVMLLMLQRLGYEPGLEAGVDDFLSKPLSARDLREALERCERG